MSSFSKLKAQGIKSKELRKLVEQIETEEEMKRKLEAKRKAEQEADV